VAVDLNDASAWRLELARRYIEPYRERAAIAVLGGSVAQGVADRWSDIDTIVYWDEIDRDWLETPRAGADGDRFTWVEHYPGNACLEQYRFGTVKADVAHVRLGWLDELIEGTLSGESFDTTSLDVLRGVEESQVVLTEPCATSAQFNKSANQRSGPGFSPAVASPHTMSAGVVDQSEIYSLL